MKQAAAVVLRSGAEPRPGWQAQVAGAQELELKGRPDAAARQLLNAAPAALVDAGEAAPMALVQRARSADSAVQVVIVTTEAQRAAIERAVVLTPGIGEAWVVPPEEVGPDLVARAAEVTAARRGSHATRTLLSRSLRPQSAGRRTSIPISDAYLAALLLVTPDPVLSVDDGGRILSWNDAAEAAFGGDGVGRQLTAVLKAREGDTLERLLAEGRSRTVRGELSYVNAQGREVFAELAVTPVQGLSEPVRAVVVHDVTEQREVQRRLEEQAAELEAQREELYTQTEEVLVLLAEREAILGQIADGVIVADAEGRLSFVNEAARRLHGVRELDVAIESYAEQYNLLTLEGTPYPSEQLPLARAVLHDESVTNAEWLVRRPDGEVLHVQGSAAPVRDSDGRKIGAVLTMRDVTQSRRLEEEKDALLEARDAALAEARTALASRGKFYASMSHEIRTPINAILGFNDLLLAGVYGPLLPAQLEGVQRGQAAAHHLLDLVNDVLDLSKIESGKIDIAVEPVSISGLLRDILTTMQPVAQERGAELRLEIDDCPGEIHTDPRRVRQIMMNLLSNASKFGAGKPVDVRCRAGRGPMLRIEVEDYGPGIRPEDLEAIFEEFVQLHDEQGGTGLGLPISKRLAHALGGDLSVESQPGRGSVFAVLLPLGHPPPKNP